MAALQQMAHLQNTLATKRSEFDEAAKALDTLVALETLVSQLGATVPEQTQHLAAAKSAVENFGQFASETVTRGQAIEPATTALSKLAEVRDQAIATGQKTDGALAAISGLATVTQTATSAGERTEAAIASVQGLATLKNEVIVQQAQTAEARAQLAEMAAMHKALIDQHALTSDAANAVTALTTLKAQIVDNSVGVETAQVNANKLVELNKTLAAQADLDKAEKNLTGLVQLENTLASQTRQIAESVESLQLLTGLQGEFNDQMVRLEEIQKGFTELLLMETYVARAVKMVQPLAELGSLRRNSEPEIRAAAREILNRREERMAMESSKFAESSGDYNPPVKPVPNPPADQD
jgi:hypothetical protein